MLTCEFQNYETIHFCNFNVNHKLQKEKNQMMFQNGTGHLAVTLASVLTETISVCQREVCISFLGKRLCLPLQGSCSRRAARCNGAFLPQC